MRMLKRDDRGFTLLEVILAIAILAMISIPLMDYFMDSIRTAARMEQKQKATLLAQETIEDMKSQDKLIRKVLGPTGLEEYWIPSMAGTNSGDTSGFFQVASAPAVEGGPAPTFDTSTGKGTIRLVRYNANVEGQHYDVVVDLSTELAANAKEQVVVHGIDDRKNALIVERDEEQEAMAYFLALNATYKLGVLNESDIEFADASSSESSSEGTEGSEGEEEDDEDEDEDEGEAHPAPDLVPQYDSVEELRKSGNVKREIYIEIGNEGESSKYYYTVRVHYKYICKNINDKPSVEMDTGDIYNSRIANLESIYLLFNIFDPENDTIYVNTDSSIDDLNPSEHKAPEIVLMCQNLNALSGGLGAEPTDPEDGAPLVTFPDADAYTPTLYLDDRFNIWAGTNPKIRTNIVIHGEDSSVKGKIRKINPGGVEDEYMVEDMTAKSEDVRVVLIDISVYKEGEFASGGVPLVQMQTTKSE